MPPLTLFLAIARFLYNLPTYWQEFLEALGRRRFRRQLKKELTEELGRKLTRAERKVMRREMALQELLLDRARWTAADGLAVESPPDPGDNLVLGPKGNRADRGREFDASGRALVSDPPILRLAQERLAETPPDVPEPHDDGEVGVWEVTLPVPSSYYSIESPGDTGDDNLEIGEDEINYGPIDEGGPR